MSRELTLLPDITIFITGKKILQFRIHLQKGGRIMCNTCDSLNFHFAQMMSQQDEHILFSVAIKEDGKGTRLIMYQHPTVKKDELIDVLTELLHKEKNQEIFTRPLKRTINKN